MRISKKVIVAAAAVAVAATAYAVYTAVENKRIEDAFKDDEEECEEDDEDLYVEDLDEEAADGSN